MDIFIGLTDRLLAKYYFEFAIFNGFIPLKLLNFNRFVIFLFYFEFRAKDSGNISFTKINDPIFTTYLLICVY